MRPNRIRTRLGPLDATVVQGSGSPPTLVVVLCHGFGAPGDDLVPLADELLSSHPALAENVRFVFPEAPLSLDESVSLGARAWWLIDLERRISLQQRGAAGIKQLREDVPPGLAHARRALMGAINEIARTTGLPMGRFVVGGFSQGAMLATDVTLRLDEPPAALAIFSGTLLCETEWQRRAPLLRGLEVLQSHGRQDPLLPFEMALALKDLLSAAELSVEFTPFDGGHQIGMEALERFGRHLESLMT
ncbi:MAG: phospholipase [Deltaproteobacteria bacterium]